MNGCSETADEHIQWMQSGNEETSLFSCLFSLVSFALLLFYYYMLLCVHATFFHAFLKGRMENGKDPNPVGRSYKKKCWFLIHLIIREVWELNQLLELRVKESRESYMQVSDSLE